MKLKRIQNSSTYKAALRVAAKYLTHPDELNKFADRAIRKSKRYQKGPLKEVWDSMSTLLRLVKAYAKGQYRNVSWKTLLTIVAALVYFVVPTDVVPDFLLGWGLIDDVMLITWVVRHSRSELDRFQDWESQSSINCFEDQESAQDVAKANTF